MSGHTDRVEGIKKYLISLIAVCFTFSLSKAQHNLEVLLNKDPGNASLTALEGAFMGYEMGINKLKAVVIDPKAKEKIIDYDPDIKWVKEDLYPGCGEKAVRDRFPVP